MCVTAPHVFPKTLRNNNNFGKINFNFGAMVYFKS